MEKKSATKKVIIFLLCFFIILNIISIFMIMRYFPSPFPKITGLEGFVGFVRLFIEEWRTLNITSPQNITYNFDRGVNYTLDLNVSSNFEVSSWWYTLIDLTHSLTVSENVSFTPNTTFNATRWSNKLIVYANRTGNLLYNSSVEFFVNVLDSAPTIEGLESEIFVCENSYLSYYFNVTDIDEDTPSASISPSNPFYAAFSSKTNSITNKYEIYSGTLSKAHAGGANAGWKVYEENVSVTDGSYVDSKKTNITVIEINRAPVIDNIGVQTIFGRGENSTFYKQVQVTDIEDGNQDSGNLSFNITILNSTGSVVNLFNISSNGIMNFTANSSKVGVYNITIYVIDNGLLNPHQNISLCVQNGSNRTSAKNFSLTVTSENRAPTISSYYPTNLSLNVSGADTSYFNITKYDADGTIPDAYWYVDSSLIETDSGSSIDEFTYGLCGISGQHTVKVEITDGLLTDSAQWNLTVNYVACPVTPPAGGVGGVGGGRAAAFCEEKWGCGEWETCQNAEETLKEGILSKENYRAIKESCIIEKLDEEFCGFQTRNCFDVNYCNTTQKKPQVIQICYYTKIPSCSDGIKNCHDGACEVLVDCSGPCSPCPTCSDGIQNQGEGGIDCGGPCPWTCPPEKPLVKKPLRYILIILVIILVLIIIFKLTKRSRQKRGLFRKARK